MKEFELNNLESKIEQLIESFQQIKLENSALKKKISDLNSENVSLLDKQKNTSGSLKNLILKLQDELVCQN